MVDSGTCEESWNRSAAGEETQPMDQVISSLDPRKVVKTDNLHTGSYFEVTNNIWIFGN
jgi:hypothetical protein